MAARYDITIYQGSTFSLPLTIKNADGTLFNLTDYIGRGQVRRHMRSTTVAVNLTVTITSPGTLGQIIVGLTPAQTAGITAGESATDQRSKYVYDVEIYKGTPGAETVVTRLLEGYAYIDPEVTR